MRLLLDTHLLLWALGAPSKLPTRARSLVAKGDVYVSAASIWEISIKSALGQLTADPREVLVELSIIQHILDYTRDHWNNGTT